nr:MAG TPA: hypothetical protein [Caudoviricetes sp.]
MLLCVCVFHCLYYTPNECKRQALFENIILIECK